MTTTSAVALETRFRIPGRASVVTRLALRAASLGLRANCHHGSPSASSASTSVRGRTHGGLPSCRSKPPRANTVAKSSSQWKNPCCSATVSQTLSHGWLLRTSLDIHCPGEVEVEFLGVVQVIPVAALRQWRHAAGSSCAPRALRPSSAWHASIHWSRVGGVAPPVSVSGQNQSAAQASMTRRSRWYAPFRLLRVSSICSRVTAWVCPESSRPHSGMSRRASASAICSRRSVSCHSDSTRCASSTSALTCLRARLARDGRAPLLQRRGSFRREADRFLGLDRRAPAARGEQEVVDAAVGLPRGRLRSPSPRPCRSAARRSASPSATTCRSPGRACRPPAGRRSASCRGAAAGRTTGPAARTPSCPARARSRPAPRRSR